MTETTTNNEIHIYFNKSYVNHHRHGLIGIFIGGLFFGFISFFASPFHDLTHPIGLISFVYFLLIFVIIAVFLASRFRFMSTGSPALIFSDKGITDNSSVISKGFFIPYRDILGVKAAILGSRRYHKDIETGEVYYRPWVPRMRLSNFVTWGRGPSSNLMLMTGGKQAAYSISLKLVNREKYAPKRNNPIYHDGEGLIYNIFCSPIDIPVLELLRLIRERTQKHYSPREEEDQYEAKLRELRSGGD